MKLQRNFAQVGAGSLAAAMLFGGALLANAQTTGAGGAVYGSGTTGTVTGTNGTTGAPAAVNSTTTTTTTTGSTGTVTPGAPNTGAGGDAASNLALLTAAGAAALGGAIYLSRRSNALRA